MMPVIAQGALLLVVSSTLVGVAILVARALRLERGLLGARASDPHSTRALIDRLAEVADLAQRRGVIQAEASVNPRVEPLLAHGLRLVSSGIGSSQLRAKLDATAEDLRRSSTRSSRAILLQAGVALVAAMLLVAGLVAGAVSAVSGVVALGGWVMTVAIIAGLAAMPVLAWGAWRLDAVASSSAAAELNDGLTIQGIALIAAGSKPAMVRLALEEFLPPAMRSPQAGASRAAA